VYYLRLVAGVKGIKGKLSADSSGNRRPVVEEEEEEEQGEPEQVGDGSRARSRQQKQQ